MTLTTTTAQPTKLKVKSQTSAKEVVNPAGMTLSDYMEARFVLRNENYQLRVLKTFEPLENLQERVVVGLLSWTLLDRRERWIKPKAVLYTRYGVQTASEVSRDYLDYKFPVRLRALSRQVQNFKLHRSAPLYCRPGVYEDHCYIDLKAAFWSIMSLAGWDVDYNPNRWITAGTPPLDFPLATNKVARNCLVSAGRPTPMKLWTGTRFVRKYAPNVHINLGLWALIMDILNSIASDAVLCEAKYIHTDGYIIPIYRAYDLQERIAAYGLTAEIKMNSIGQCIMLGMGNWQCGERKTKRFNKSRGMGRVDTIYKVDPRLIMRKMVKFANRQKRTNQLDSIQGLDV